LTEFKLLKYIIVMVFEHQQINKLVIYISKKKKKIIYITNMEIMFIIYKFLNIIIINYKYLFNANFKKQGYVNIF